MSSHLFSPRWLRCAWMAGYVGLSWFTSAAIARGQAGAVRVQLDYQAPPVCPPSSGFEAELGPRLGPDGALAASQRRLRVRISETRKGFQGRLTVGGSSNEATPRDLESGDCHELVRALALIAAVVLNPAERSEPSSGSVPVPPAPNPRGPVAAPISPPPGPESPPRPLEPPPVRSSVHRIAGSPRWRLVAGMALTAERGPMPGWVWVPRPIIGTDLDFTGSRWTVGARVSATQAKSTVRGAVGLADLTWTSVRLEACAVPFRSSRLRGGLCGLIDLGTLAGEAQATPGISAAASDSTTWAAPGALLGGEARLIGPLWAMAEVGMTTPLVRTSFYFGRRASHQPDQNVHQVKSAALTAGLGILVRWP